jgi:uncharacterized membrane protein
MIEGGHLWAIGFDNMERAEQVRAEIIGLAGRSSLVLHETAVALRFPDGLVLLDGEPFVEVTNLKGHSFARFLASLALGAPPLTGAAAGMLVRATGGRAAEAGIDESFVSEVQAEMKPGSSVLFVLDQAGDMAAILQGIRGLGGTVLKTNVDLERAKLIQSTLTAVQ